MLKQFVCAVLFAIMFTSCAYNTTNIEPPHEPHYRVIPSEPEENANNHLKELRLNEENQLLPIGPDLFLKSAIREENYSVEYYVSALRGSDGSFTFDSPSYNTLLVRTNGKIYPLESVVYNYYISSLICAENVNGNVFNIWVMTEYPALALYEYAYDSESDSFRGTGKYYNQDGRLTVADLNHSLEDIADGKVVFGSTRTTLT
jgi:hypothetical protein